jgi:hypothetical protein
MVDLGLLRSALTGLIRGMYALRQGLEQTPPPFPPPHAGEGREGVLDSHLPVRNQ